jgi:hypothetical protein
MPTLKFKGKAAQAVFDALTAAPEYLVMYKGDRSGDVLWWRPKRCGYTIDVAQAGRYTKEEAESIAGIRGLDFPVPLSDIGTRLKVRQVVCMEDEGNSATIKSYQANPRSEPK